MIANRVNTLSVGLKPFAAEHHALRTHCKTAVQRADTAFLQRGGLFWYPRGGTLPFKFINATLPFGFIDATLLFGFINTTLPLGLPLSFIGFIGDYLLCLQVWES